MSGETVAVRVVRRLRDMGVRHVFGVPSGGWVDYMEALRETEGIDFVLTSHEGGAGFMADVCGRLTGAPGVCFGTFGPGATNLATGVGGALLDRSPMIALTDEMPAAMRGRVTQMGIDHQALFAPITRRTLRLDAENVDAILGEAAAVALEGRPGPVHIGLPAGLSAEIAGGEAVAAPVAPPPRPDPAQLDALETAFRAARKPVLALGLGAVRAGVGRRVAALAERFALPVVLTPMAKGLLPESHPCYAGVLFHALSDMVGETHAQADLVVAIGYDPVEFNYEGWMRDGLPLASIDISPADIDRARHPVAADVVGDIAAGLVVLEALEAESKDWALAEVSARKAAMFARMRPRGGRMGPCAVLEVLREVLPDDGIMTCDVGAHTHLIGQKWPTPAPGLQIMTNGWSAMGFGLPAAIAAQLCRPDRKVCAVVGDGGFLMTVGELATAVRERLPVVVLVLTDNELALIRIKQQRKQHPVHGTLVRGEGAIGGPSLFGAPVTTVSTPEALRAALAEAFAADDGPRVVEALIDASEYDGLVLRRDKP